MPSKLGQQRVSLSGRMLHYATVSPVLHKDLRQRFRVGLIFENLICERQKSKRNIQLYPKVKIQF